MFANTRDLRRYVQHLTLPAAYGHAPEPTFDGASLFWYEVAPRRPVVSDPEVTVLGSRRGRLVRRRAGFTDAAGAGRWPSTTRSCSTGAASGPCTSWTYNDWGVGGLGDEEIRRRVRRQGDRALAADPGGPAACAPRPSARPCCLDRPPPGDDRRLEPRPRPS